MEKKVQRFNQNFRFRKVSHQAQSDSDWDVSTTMPVLQGKQHTLWNRQKTQARIHQQATTVTGVCLCSRDVLFTQPPARATKLLMPTPQGRRPIVQGA